jgi:hypothetical protein
MNIYQVSISNIQPYASGENSPEEDIISADRYIFLKWKIVGSRIIGNKRLF